jgi:hypothetical protein
MLQTIQPAQSVLAAVYPYLQLFSALSIVFALAWWARSTKEDILSRLDVIESNHLHTIEENTGKMLPKQDETNMNLIRIVTILEERTGVTREEKP